MHLGCMTTLAIGSNVPEGAACGASTTLPTTASKPTIKPTIIGEKIGIVSSSSRAQLIAERQLPDAPAGGGENRVRHRGSGDGRAWFADSAWRFQVAHQVHLDGRRLVDSHDSNVMEVGLLDPAVLERHAVHRAPLIPKIMPLSIWAFTVSGFTTVPQSTAQTTRWTRTSPAFDTETSATCAR